MKKIGIIVALCGFVLAACNNAELPKTEKSTDSATKKPSITVVSVYTADDLKSHATKENCWLAIEGKVYNVTEYIEKHPGGDKLIKGCGIDATDYFNGNGKGRMHSAFARTLLAGYYIGDFQK